MKSIKVLAYITAYEDNKAVKNCVQALKNQSFPIDKIFIVDNSCVNPVLLPKCEDILIRRYPENLGVSGGLKLALELAIIQEYDFLWAFDQDSVPTSDCLRIIIETYHRLDKIKHIIGIIAPTSIDLRTNTVVECAKFIGHCFKGCKHNSQLETYECDSPITSGSLISIAAAKTISFPCVDLFIDGVDLDYGLQLRQNGFVNLIVTQAIMHHNFGNPLKVKFLHRELDIQQYSALRHYYICRNYTYLEMKYARGWYRLYSFKHRIKYLLYSTIKILLYDSENKALKIWACLLGTYHGFQYKLGKIWI